MTDTDCIACALALGTRDLPGGTILSESGWLLEHCVGPLGVGTLILKPARHVTGVAELTDDEAAALGPLLRAASRCVRDLTGATQVYNCLWSHAGFEASHIHYVVQPVTEAHREAYALPGPALQVAMFGQGVSPAPQQVADFCDRARAWFEDR